MAVNWFAHRGLYDERGPQYYPTENSLESFKRALADTTRKKKRTKKIDSIEDITYQGVELDARPDKFGKPVVLHDASIDRTCLRSPIDHRYVKNMNFSLYPCVKLKDKASCLPTLVESLLLVKSYENKHVVIDVKSTRPSFYHSVVQLVKSMKMEHRTTLLLWYTTDIPENYPRTLRALDSALPGCHLLQKLKRNNYSGVSIRLDQEKIAKAVERAVDRFGMYLNVYVPKRERPWLFANPSKLNKINAITI